MVFADESEIKVAYVKQKYADQLRQLVKVTNDYKERDTELQIKIVECQIKDEAIENYERSSKANTGNFEKAEAKTRAENAKLQMQMQNVGNENRQLQEQTQNMQKDYNEIREVLQKTLSERNQVRDRYKELVKQHKDEKELINKVIEG